MLMILYAQNTLGYYLEYDKSSQVSKVKSINGISKIHSECGLKTFEGNISKVERINSNLELSVNTNSGTEFVQFDIKEFSMSELRSMNTILSVGQRIKVEGQVCGSGGFFYPVNIIDLGKKKTIRGWVDETLGKFGLEK
jgi:hypothetical protein